jgi:hypothetical protein
MFKGWHLADVRPIMVVLWWSTNHVFCFCWFLVWGQCTCTLLPRCGDNICSSRLPLRHKNNHTGNIIDQVNNCPGELFLITRDEYMSLRCKCFRGQ